MGKPKEGIEAENEIDLNDVEVADLAVQRRIVEPNLTEQERLHTYDDEFVALEFSEKDESDEFVEDHVFDGEVGYE